MTQHLLKPWEAYVDHLSRAQNILKLTWRPDDAKYRADVYRQIFMNLSAAYFAYFQSDPHHPDWMPQFNSVFQLQPNPDDVYLCAPLDSNCDYLISGERGSIHLLCFTIGGNLLGHAEVAGPASCHFDHRSLAIGSGGRFELLLSKECPAGHDGNWRKLEDSDDYVMVRLRSYDWGNEQDPRISIECLNPPVSLKPRMASEEIAEKLDLLVGFSDRLSGSLYAWQNALRDRVGKNTFEFTQFTDWGGLAIQEYWQAIYELNPGEALILETELPRERLYWNVQINDPYFNAIEFIYRQSSINGHTAVIDSDGKFRAVIALEDPGVANWLDPAGFTEGTVIGRWYDCSSRPHPTLRQIAFSDIREALPADTRLCSAAQRQEALRSRRIGGQRRRRW